MLANDVIKRPSSSKCKKKQKLRSISVRRVRNLYDQFGRNRDKEAAAEGTESVRSGLDAGRWSDRSGWSSTVAAFVVFGFFVDASTAAAVEVVDVDVPPALVLPLRSFDGAFAAAVLDAGLGTGCGSAGGRATEFIYASSCGVDGRPSSVFRNGKRRNVRMTSSCR